MEDVERFFHTSNILLAHFHFVCNGSAPLRVNWRDPSLCQMAKLTTEEVGFMENIIAKIRDRGIYPVLAHISGEVVSDFYIWISGILDCFALGEQVRDTPILVSPDVFPRLAASPTYRRGGGMIQTRFRNSAFGVRWGLRRHIDI